MPFIRVKPVPAKGRVFEVKDDVITLGRDESQTIQILDQGSPHPCRDLPSAASAVRDLNSTNGTFVNNIKVTEEALKPGDEMLIGRTILSFEERIVDDDRPAHRLEPIETTTRARGRVVHRQQADAGHQPRGPVAHDHDHAQPRPRAHLDGGHQRVDPARSR
jgi:pSer/pThr/pTyr-binding forkhead associated (FHA) protein